MRDYLGAPRTLHELLTAKEEQIIPGAFKRILYKMNSRKEHKGITGRALGPCVSWEKKTTSAETKDLKPIKDFNCSL